MHIPLIHFYFILFCFFLIHILSDTKYREKTTTVNHYFLLLPIPYFNLQKKQQGENIVQSTVKYISYILNCICFLKFSSYSVGEKCSFAFDCLDCSTLQYTITEIVSFSLIFWLLFFLFASSFAGLLA